MAKRWTRPRDYQRGAGRAPRQKRRAGGRPRWWPSWGEWRLAVTAGAFLGLGAAHVTEEGAHLLTRSGLVLGERVTVTAPGTVRAVDGDTLAWRGTRIRLLGIDAPETAARCAAEAEGAVRAKARLQALVRAGPFDFEATLGRDRDRYGRLLRRASRDGESFAAVLLSEGLVRPYAGGARGDWCG